MILQKAISKYSKGFFCTSKYAKQTVNHTQATPQHCPASTIDFLVFYTILKLC